MKEQGLEQWHVPPRLRGNQDIVQETHGVEVLEVQFPHHWYKSYRTRQRTRLGTDRGPQRSGMPFWSGLPLGHWSVITITSTITSTISILEKNDFSLNFVLLVFRANRLTHGSNGDLAFKEFLLHLWLKTMLFCKCWHTHLRELENLGNPRLFRNLLH